ncbi:MAG: hypothetical protein ACFFAN_03340, partial [Promethearchaeota archaeon]
MNDLIPIEQVLEENLWVNELEKQGFIIKPEKIDEYLKEFENRKTALPNENNWKDKRVLITGISGFAGSHLAEQ